MRLRATRSSSQALAAATTTIVTGLCGRGHHDDCSGRVYAPHLAGRAKYLACGCDCHREAEAA